MKENGNRTNYVRKYISKLFIQPTSLPPFLEYFVTLFEFFVFTIFVSSNSHIDSLIFGSVIQRNLIIFLIGLLFLRFITRITIIKSIYILIIVWNMQCTFGIMSIIVYGLLLVNVTIDIFSKVEFSYETKNLHSSTYPWFIALHYLVFCSLTVQRYLNIDKTFIFPLCEALSIVLLIIIQFRAIMKYQEFKSLQLRFYFLSVFYAIAESFEVFVAEEPFWKNLFAIVVSQLVYEFIQWKTNTDFTVEEYLSKKMEV